MIKLATIGFYLSVSEECPDHYGQASQALQ